MSAGEKWVIQRERDDRAVPLIVKAVRGPDEEAKVATLYSFHGGAASRAAKVLARASAFGELPYMLGLLHRLALAAPQHGPVNPERLDRAIGEAHALLTRLPVGPAHLAEFLDVPRE